MRQRTVDAGQRSRRREELAFTRAKAATRGFGSRVRPHLPVFGTSWRRARRVAFVALAVAGLVYAATSFVVAWVLTAGTHSTLEVPASSIGPVHDDVEFPSRVDRLELHGWLFHAGTPTGRSAILVHGWQGNREDVGSGAWEKARDMLRHGYDVLLFDLRSCGESDGSRFTLGTDEPRDLLGAHDFMTSRGYRPQDMVILGVSMGAATVVEAAPQMPDVAALVVDSAFSDLRPLIETQLPERSHLPGLFNAGIVTVARAVFGVDPDLRPVDVVRSLPARAFLFVAASGDDFIPVADTRDLYGASANPDSREMILPASGHTKEYLANPAAYMDAVYAFADQQVADRA